MKLQNPKDYPNSLKAGLIIILSLLLFVYIPQFISNSNVLYIPIAIQEIGEMEYTHGFTITYKNIFKMVFLGLVHGLICYFSIHGIINRIGMRQNDPEQIQSHKKTKIALDFSLVFFIMVNAAGHIVHWLFDMSNQLYRTQMGYDDSSLYSLLYFSDEFLGHAMVHISYFAFFTILVIAEYLGQSPRKIKWDECILLLIVIIGIGAINGEAARVGESAVPLLILSICFILFSLIYIMIKKLNPLKYPILLAMIIGSIIVIILIVLNVIFYGTLPVYPYIT